MHKMTVIFEMFTVLYIFTLTASASTAQGECFILYLYPNVLFRFFCAAYANLSWRWIIQSINWTILLDKNELILSWLLNSGVQIFNDRCSKKVKLDVCFYSQLPLVAYTQDMPNISLYCIGQHLQLDIFWSVLGQYFYIWAANCHITSDKWII